MSWNNLSSKGWMIAGVTSSLVMIPVQLFAFFGLIWYEHNASDLTRVFINRMVTSVSWSAMAWIVLVQTPEMLRHIFGPFPVLLCRVQFVAKNATLIQIVLFYDAMVVVRYLSIFVLKNPLEFQNEFWTFFVNVAVVFFSLASQTVYLLLPGTEPLQTKICSGQLEADSSPAKVNWQFLVVMVGSLCLHVGANGRIKAYKIRQNMRCFAAERLSRGKDAAVSIVETLVISDCIANLFILVALVATGVLTLYVDQLDPAKVDSFPDSLVSML